MARNTTPAPQSKEPLHNESAIAQEVAAANQLAVQQQQQDARVTALAKRLNYQGSTDVAVLENSARDAIRRMGMTVFELGAYLLLLREVSVHGKFLPTLERLGLAPRAAQQYMSVARRFASKKSIAHLESAGIAKLVELVALDDEQIEQLTELGQTGELALDDVATMSVKQLRAAVRELRSEEEASKALLEKKNARIDQLSRRIQKLTPDETLNELQREATGLMNDAIGCIRGNLRQAIIAVRNHGDEDHTPFLAGLLGQVQADLVALRDEFGLPDVSNAADLALAAEMAQWNK